MFSAKILCKSVSPTGKTIISFELEYPRFIHSELMTHRVFSRNAASSRAIPIDKMMQQVLDAPAMPIEWGLNKAGMQAGDMHHDSLSCIYVWKDAAKSAVDSAKALQSMGLHKQIVNRVLEPFQTMKTIVTSTEWDNFYELRTHADAQPEFQYLAKLMQAADESTEAQELAIGQWHLPYIDTYICPEYGDITYSLDDEDQTGLSLEDAIKVSASCCAQVSYRVLDDSVAKAVMIYDRLVNSTPIHASPFEHQATPLGKADVTSGNFFGWEQYRQTLSIKY